MRVAFAISCLLAFSLAGCASDDAPDEAPDVTPAAPGATINEPIPDPTTDADSPVDPSTATWWAEIFNVDGETTASSFWRVPADATGTISLDVTPLVDDVEAVSQYGFLVFRFADEEAHFVAAHFGDVFHFTDRGVPDLGVDGTYSIDLAPFRMSLPGVAAGDIIGIIQAGEGTTDAFGFAWTLSQGDLAQNMSTFFAGLEGQQGATVTPLAFGNSFHAAYYLDVNQGLLTVPPGFTGATIWNDDITVTEAGPVDLRPVVSVRSSSLLSAHATDAGWGYTMGGHEGALGALVWDADGNLHGHALNGGAITVNTPVVSTGDLLLTAVLGRPDFILTGEGEGAGNFAASFLSVNVDLVEGVGFLHFDLDTPLEQMFGLPGTTFGFSSNDIRPA